MRKHRSLVATLVAGTGAALLAAGLIAEAALAAEPDMKDAGIAEKMNEIGGRTLSEIAAAQKNATVILSPYGLGSALHLLMLGASAGSEAEKSLRKSLVADSVGDLDKARESFRAINKAVLGAGKDDKVDLKSVSAVFVPQTATVSDNFGMKAPKVLDAPVEALNFKSPKALESVNAWVSKSTNGQIPSVLEKLEPDARFVLVNAVYFKAAWETAFDPAQTVKAPFTHVDGTQRADVPIMSATLPAELAELGELKAVWLPYAGKDIAMVVIAPGGDGAPTLVADALKGTSIDKLIAAAGKEAQRRSVHVRLPRFRAESFLNITDALAGQIGPALRSDAAYTPISGGKTSAPLVVMHRVVVDVSEAGTVAAAATAITGDRSLSITPVVSADRPFAFAIVHRPTRAVLFAGYVADPGEAPAP